LPVEAQLLMLNNPQITNPGLFARACQFFHTIRGSNDFMGYGPVSLGCWILFQEIGSFYISDDLLETLKAQRKYLERKRKIVIFIIYL
jgi:hypothetical protein